MTQENEIERIAANALCEFIDDALARGQSWVYDVPDELMALHQRVHDAGLRVRQDTPGLREGAEFVVAQWTPAQREAFRTALARQDTPGLREALERIRDLGPGAVGAARHIAADALARQDTEARPMDCGDSNHAHFRERLFAAIRLAEAPELAR